MPTIQRDRTTGRSCRNADGLTVKCGCDACTFDFSTYLSARFSPTDRTVVNCTSCGGDATCIACNAARLALAYIPEMTLKRIGYGAGSATYAASFSRETEFTCSGRCESLGSVFAEESLSAFLRFTVVSNEEGCFLRVEGFASSSATVPVRYDLGGENCPGGGSPTSAASASTYINEMIEVTGSFPTSGTSPFADTACGAYYDNVGWELLTGSSSGAYSGDWNAGFAAFVAGGYDCIPDDYPFTIGTYILGCDGDTEGTTTETNTTPPATGGTPKFKQTFYIDGPCACGQIQYDGLTVIPDADYPGDSDGPWTYNADLCRWEYVRYFSNSIILGLPDYPTVPAYVVASLSLVLGGGFSACLAHTGGCTWSYSDTGFSCSYTVSGTTATLSGYFTVGFVCVYPFSVTFSLDCASGTCLPSDTVNQTVYTTDEGCQPDREGTFSVGDGSGCGGEP